MKENKSIKKIIIFGVQGSGKGTQAEMISRYCYLKYISTGDIFRREIKDGTELGRQAAYYINDGHLVPDEITNSMVKKNLNLPVANKKGFVLDGYPRTLAQAKALDAMADLTDAVVIDITDREAVARLAGRLACKCGLSYHQIFNPPKRAGFCDRCGGKLFVRDDDKLEAIKKRIKIYHQETEPLIDYYADKGILKKIDGAKEIRAVFEDIVRELKILSCKKIN